MLEKPLLSQTKAARTSRYEEREEMYLTVRAQSWSERYLRGFLLRGNIARTSKEDLELSVNTIVINGYDSFGRAYGCPESVSDVVRGLWRLQAQAKFSEMVAKDHALVSGYHFSIRQCYLPNSALNTLLGIVEEEVQDLFRTMVTMPVKSSRLEFREATMAELLLPKLPDGWVMITDRDSSTQTGVLIRPRLKSMWRVNSSAVINSDAFITAVYNTTRYQELWNN